MKIVLVGGKTMGHITPLLGIGNELINNFKKSKIIYYGSYKSIEEEIVRKNPHFWFRGLNVRGLNRKNIFKAIYSLCLYKKAYKEVLKDFKLEKPSIVISSGGFVSASVLKACVKLNVPYVLLEQNVVMGLTNKYYAKNARYTLMSFEKTRQEIRNGVLTGNPIITKKVERKEEYILAVGGSLGASKINEVVSKLNIKFITGKREYKKYEDNPNAIEYSNDLYELMSKASIIISRAGGSTIYEILSLKKPLILIPSPNVSNNHQEKNARYLEKNNCCKVILENELSVEKLKEMIGLLNEVEREKMIKAQEKMYISDSINRCMKKITEVIYENISQ